MAIIYGTEESGVIDRRPIESEGRIYHRGDWMQSGDDPVFAPRTFLLEQPPDTTLDAHYHRHNEFQLFVAGDGRVGRHALAPVTVHYAGAYTGYGPIVSGPNGLSYFTCRMVRETGFIPVTDRASMVAGPKRQATSEAMGRLDASRRTALDRPVSDVLIPVGPDGMGATSTHLPPGAVLALAHPAFSVGQFVFVVDGELAIRDMALAPLEHVFIAPSDEPSPITAGSTGASVIAMYMPRRDDAYGSTSGG